MTVYGPIKHGRRYRLRIREGKGQRVVSFETELEAQAELKKLRKQITAASGITVRQALEEYRNYLTRKKNVANSIKSTMYRVGGFLADEIDSPLPTITNAKALYRKYQLGKSVDSSRNALAETKSFFTWAVGEKYLKTSPLQDVKGEGQRRKGEKEQLTRDELAKFVVAGMRVVASTRSERRRMRAVLAVMQACFGTRPSELFRRQVRDLDDGGSSLRIPKGKTKKAKRRLEIPDWLKPWLLQHVRGKTATELLFPNVDKDVVRKAVRMICREAEVVVVSPYGLRGGYASATAAEARAPQVIQDAMGHESFTTTQTNYMQSESYWTGQQTRFEAVVGPAIQRGLAGLVPGTSETWYQPQSTQPPSEKVLEKSVVVELNGIEPSAS